MVASTAESPRTVTGAPSTTRPRGAAAHRAENSKQAVMADVYVMHRRMTIEGKGAGRPDAPYVIRDSRADFHVREAAEQEATDAAKSLKAAVDARVQELKTESAIRARMAELRAQGWRP